MSRQHSQGRRSFLKLVGAGAALSAVPVVNAEPAKGRDLFERALHVQEQTGDRMKYRKFVRNHGWTVAATDLTFSVPTNSSYSQDGVSTQKLDKNDLEISISLSEDCYENFYGKLTWNWGNNDYDDIGDNPRDAVGLMWKESSWYVPSDGDTYGSKFIGNEDNPSKSPTGLGFTYHDGNDLEVFGAGGADRWVAADLAKPSDEYTASGRQLWAEYYHAWGGGNFVSVSVENGELKVETDAYHGGSSHEWYKGTDQNGNKLITSEAEASNTC